MNFSCNVISASVTILFTQPIERDIIGLNVFDTQRYLYLASMWSHIFVNKDAVIKKCDNFDPAYIVLFQEHIEWNCRCSFIKCNQLTIYLSRFALMFVMMIATKRVNHVKMEHKVQFGTINIKDELQMIRLSMISEMSKHIKTK